jgi:hypothetical protein
MENLIGARRGVRGAVTAVATAMSLVAGAIALGPGSAGAAPGDPFPADWPPQSWYGVVSFEDTYAYDGGSSHTVGRIRVSPAPNGQQYSLVQEIQVTGTSTVEDLRFDCTTTSRFVLDRLEPTSAGGPEGFFGVTAHPGTGMYSIGLTLHEAGTVTETQVGAGCLAPGTVTRDHGVAHVLSYGCGPATELLPAPCQTNDPAHLVGNVDYRDAFGQHKASWDLVTDPAADPCVVTPALCAATPPPGTEPPPGSEEPLPTVTVTDRGRQATVASRCGSAGHDWGTVTGGASTVRSGEQACVFLLGNDLAQELLAVSLSAGVSLGTAFGGTVFDELVVEYADDVTLWSEQQLAKRTLLRALARSFGVRGFGPITSLGNVVAINGVALGGLILASQIEAHNACVQVIVSQDGRGGLEFDASLVYAQARDRSLTQANTYEVQSRRLRPDRIVPVSLGLTCERDGTATVAGSSRAFNRSTATSAFFAG